MHPCSHENHESQSTYKMLTRKCHPSMSNQVLDEHERTHKLENQGRLDLEVLSQLTMNKVVYDYFFVTPSELV